MSQMITRALLNTALTFDDYMELTIRITGSTPQQGVYQNEKTFRYTQSNLKRMQQVLEHTVMHQKLYNALSELKEKWLWLVISEPWCGDASWGTPALYLISKATENIEFKILLRDSNSGLMKGYQTEGSDSIPKLICLRAENLQELGTWGPRPCALQDLVTGWKNTPGTDYRESVRLLHAWYEEDKSNHIQDEITELVKKWKG